MAIILGIDPGSRITGYGIINAVDGENEYIASGCIHIKEIALSERLCTIFSSLNKIIIQYSPQQMAIEQVFVAHNPSSALKLGQARGAAIVAGVNQHLPVAEYSAKQVKQAVVGKGAADKWQVQHMIMALLGLNKKPPQDAADALAVAICHAHTQRGLEKRVRSSRVTIHKERQTIDR